MQPVTIAVSNALPVPMDRDLVDLGDLRAELERVALQAHEARLLGVPLSIAVTDPRFDSLSSFHRDLRDALFVEEDDSFVFRLDPCGSGGRLLRGAVWRDMFHYGDRLAPKMASPHRINFNRADAPTYCTHCAASNRAQLESASSPATPLFFVIDGHAQTAPGAPCRCYVYKKDARREEIDPALFEQIGLVPPREKSA